MADAPLLRQAKEQTMEWANRAVKLISSPPAHPPAKPPPAASASPSSVTLPYLHGLALEGDHVAFASAAVVEVRAHIKRVEEFQRRVLSQVDNIRRAVEERREEEAREALTLSLSADKQSSGKNSKAADSTRAPRRVGASSSPAAAGRSVSTLVGQSAISSELPLSASEREWWQCCVSLLDELIAEAVALRVSVEESRWCKRYRRDIQALLDKHHTLPHTTVSSAK